MKRIVISVILLFLSILLVSCATNRGIVNLKLPDAKVISQANGSQVFIKSVSDDREFQENPKTQDVPSLGFGGAANASIDIKKRAIARKRNGFGKALGDILLEKNQTVETVISDALKRSFAELGYEVLRNQEEITKETIVIDASIEKFWAYMTPGFWAITLSSEISTNLLITIADNDGNYKEEIYVKSDGKYQIASGRNWMEIMHKSIQKYMEQVKIVFSERKKIEIDKITEQISKR